MGYAREVYMAGIEIYRIYILHEISTPKATFICLQLLRRASAFVPHCVVVSSSLAVLI